MSPAVDLVTLSGVVALGIVHGAEPGHGWPIAATYALETSRKWFYGLVASLVIGVGHLISSLAVVGVFFLAKSRLGIAEFPWLNEIAGVLLVLLGLYEYRHGHGHAHSHSDADTDDHPGRDAHGDDHHHDHIPGIRDGGLHSTDPAHGDDHDHGDDSEHSHDDGDGHDRGHDHGSGHDHGHDHSGDNDHTHADHSHSHGELEDAADRGLWGLGSAAFALGFAHEEEFEIIGICAGTDACLTLMVVYALAVVASLVALTLLLVAGYYRYQDRVERIAPHFSTISAVVLVGMGVLFIAGVL